MARKTWMYAVLEAVQHEMRQDKDMVWIFELTPPVASNPGKPVINLEKEFGRKRVVNTGIDEYWMAACTLGAGLAGSKAVTYIPYQGACMPFELIQNEAGKLRHMSGGQAEMPVVFIMEMTGQTPGFAGQHSDYEIDTYYAHIPGVKTVIPSTPADAKGMMVSAIRDPNPVVYLYPAGLRELVEEVPDEQYTVPLDKAAVRTTGNDLTIVSSGAGMPDVLEAADQLQKAGMKVEAIDLRSLKPMDTETLVKSVQKDQTAAHVRSVVLHAVPWRRGDRPRRGERGRRALQAHCLPRCAPAGISGDVPLDETQRRSHRELGEEAGRLKPPRTMPKAALRPSAHSPNINGAPMDAIQVTVDVDSDQQQLGLCSHCQSPKLRAARVQSAFWHDDRLVVIEDVPALVCDACGEQYYDDNTVVMLDLLRGNGFPAEQAVREVRVPVFSFAGVQLAGTST